MRRSDTDIAGSSPYEYPESAWAIVVSNLPLYYIKGLGQVFRNVWRALRPGDTVLLNIDYSVFTSGVHRDRIYKENGTPKY